MAVDCIGTPTATRLVEALRRIALDGDDTPWAAALRVDLRERIRQFRTRPGRNYHRAGAGPQKIPPDVLGRAVALVRAGESCERAAIACGFGRTTLEREVLTMRARGEL